MHMPALLLSTLALGNYVLNCAVWWSCYGSNIHHTWAGGHMQCVALPRACGGHMQCVALPCACGW